MRILVTSNPLVGHFTPMVPLVEAFRSAGHQVVVASGGELARSVEAMGIEFWTVGPTMAESFAAGQSDAPDSNTDPLEALRRDVMAYFGTPGIARARALAERTARWRPDLVVHDRADFGGSETAAACQALDVAHGYGPLLPHDMALAAMICAAAADALGTGNRFNSIGQATYVDPWPARLASAEPIPYGTVVPIRPEPIRPPGGSRLPESIDALPAAPTVYATLGTVFGSPELLSAIVESSKDQGWNLIVTTGPTVDPDVLGVLPGNVVAAWFLPQELVLDRCQAVLSHAGSGTVIGALAHRLPQVCLPISADQFVNAERIGATGAGIKLAGDDRSPGAIRRAISTVLADPGFRGAAGALQSEIDAMPPADEVAQRLLTVAGAI